MFWDMASEQVNRIYELPQTNYLYKLIFKDNYIYAFCRNKLFKCSYDSPPQEYIKNGDNRFYFGKQIGNIASIYKNLLIFQAGDLGEIGAIGTNREGLPDIFQIPWSMSGTGSISISSIFGGDDAIYVSASDKIYRIHSSNDELTNVTMKTPLIDLERDWKISFIKIKTEQLASGDSISVNLYNKSSGSSLGSGTFTYTTDGNKSSKVIPINGVITNQIQLATTIVGGDPKIKSLDVFGEPLSELY
jgi:hypothetical protein